MRRRRDTTDISKPDSGVPKQGGIISLTNLASQPLLTHQVIIRTATGWTMYPFNSVNLVEKIVKCSLFRLACFD
jgi:hypothetical protein